MELSQQLYHSVRVCMRAKSLQMCPTLWDPMDCSLPISSVQGILQARILEWAAISSSREFSQPKIEPRSLTSAALASRFFTTSATWEALYHSASLTNRTLNTMNLLGPHQVVHIKTGNSKDGSLFFLNTHSLFPFFFNYNCLYAFIPSNRFR